MTIILLGLAAFSFGLGWLLVIWAARQAKKHEKRRLQRERQAYNEACE